MRVARILDEPDPYHFILTFNKKFSYYRLIRYPIIRINMYKVKLLIKVYFSIQWNILISIAYYLTYVTPISPSLI